MLHVLSYIIIIEFMKGNVSIYIYSKKPLCSNIVIVIYTIFYEKTAYKMYSLCISDKLWETYINNLINLQLDLCEIYQFLRKNKVKRYYMLVHTDK